MSSTAPGTSRRLCRKRIVTCVLLDREDRVLSVGVNQCFGDRRTGECLRLGKVSTPKAYKICSAENECDSLHAEVDALRRWDYLQHRVLQANGQPRLPYRAVISGHSFVCSMCEKELRNHGVEIIEIRSDRESAPSTLSPEVEHGR